MEFEVIDKYTNKPLSNDEILAEVNRDRSQEWTDYDKNDITYHADEVLEWLDPQYFEIRYFGEV